MAETGNPNSVSDAGVGALCARAAVLGAFMNVRINAAGCEDKPFVTDVLDKGNRIQKEAMRAEGEILAIVDGKIGA
jgi:glutamate formiminotransferase/formiminotetrahydrofolate cyclodeaminase